MLRVKKRTSSKKGIRYSTTGEQHAATANRAPCQSWLPLQNLLRLPTGKPFATWTTPPQRRTPLRHTYTAPFIWTASHPTVCLHATPGAQQTARDEKTRACERNQPFAPPFFIKKNPSSSSSSSSKSPAPPFRSEPQARSDCSTACRIQAQPQQKR